MRIRVFIIVILSLLLTCTNWCFPCQGTNLHFGGQAELRNKMVSSIEYADNYAFRGSAQNRLVNCTINIQSRQELPELKENVQGQSIRQRTKLLHYNSVMIYTYILLITIGLGFIFFRMIDRKNKQLMTLNQNEIREQIIKELKIDHQLLASRAVLLGEEKERGRISRDLHDGLGGMLSGVKLSLSSIKGSNPLPSAINENLEQTLSQLNAAISELRIIAQNLMPEALLNFGLKDALHDLCSNIAIHKNIDISFLFYGEPFRFDNSIETSLFRIAQEGINNALKYARASQIIVQLIQDESWVNLTIQDNGVGFEVDKIQNEKSGGLKNMRDRTESFDGRFNLDSCSGLGTEIIVEFICNREILYYFSHFLYCIP